MYYLPGFPLILNIGDRFQGPCEMSCGLLLSVIRDPHVKVFSSEIIGDTATGPLGRKVSETVAEQHVISKKETINSIT